MKHWLLGLLSIMLAACAVGGGAGLEGEGEMSRNNSLKDYGLAPELTNAVWLNTPDGAALRLADLRGKVVAIDFWTFG